MAALIAISGIVWVAAAASGEPSNQSQWQLNATVGGRLHAATPFALPCFSKFDGQPVEVNQAACAVIQANYTNPEFRMASFSANMNPQWETCMATGAGCLLDSAYPSSSATNGTSCDQGEIPHYYINVQTPEDIQAAFKFSASNKIPLSIKNTGHDYLGRSRQPGSLGLWTHNLDTMSYNAAFTPDSCNGSFRAITVGAGVTFEQVYKFADDNEVTFIGGYAQSIGASGGWMMGAGHSVLSPVFGLGVDRVLQIKIVTPDGEYRIANDCQNPDLFWALRGGGGGTFGVVVESTHLVEEVIPIQVANIAYTPATPQLQEYFEILVNSSVKWGEEGWGGHITAGGLIYVNPLLSLSEATDSMQQIAAFAQANNGTASFETLPSWYAFFERFILQVQESVGSLLFVGSRLIPKASFETQAGRAQLVAHLLNQTAEFGIPYIPVVPPVGFNYTPGATSVSPAWRTAQWHLATTAAIPYNSTPADIQAKFSTIHDFVENNLRRLAPDSGTYINEGEVYETDHEVAYWGSNYARLLEVKKKYDPMGLLDCWNCVGSKGTSAFPCYPALKD
ncbi:FAD-binding domain-containing protein [Mycena leptocephala]|nr:FAD-binding domain-containing protein [Mycena leptocephala]